jgi:hypothetical protein
MSGGLFGFVVSAPFAEKTAKGWGTQLYRERQAGSGLCSVDFGGLGCSR